MTLILLACLISFAAGGSVGFVLAILLVSRGRTRAGAPEESLVPSYLAAGEEIASQPRDD